MAWRGVGAGVGWVGSTETHRDLITLSQITVLGRVEQADTHRTLRPMSYLKYTFNWTLYR